ncbi:hypothetical protein WJA65_23090, partial [Salmonella enterica subsp. enterica serovar Corvallis]
ANHKEQNCALRPSWEMEINHTKGIDKHKKSHPLWVAFFYADIVSKDKSAFLTLDELNQSLITVRIDKFDIFTVTLSINKKVIYTIRFIGYLSIRGCI